MAQSNAVEARTLLDLRIGAAFTRFQSLQLQQRFQQLKEDVISYGKCAFSYPPLILIAHRTAGPCQFPTLGFVVSRYNQVKSFVPETFWYIYLALTRTDETTGDESETPFAWRRGHLFELEAALAIYEYVLDNPTARVRKVTYKNTKKWSVIIMSSISSSHNLLIQEATASHHGRSSEGGITVAEDLTEEGARCKTQIPFSSGLNAPPCLITLCLTVRLTERV